MDETVKSSEPGRHWHALVIGVDCYPAFPKKQLSGCVNDATAMRRFLVDRVQVPGAHIHLLLSPRNGSGTAGSTRATAANIRAAFDALAQPGTTGAGDHVVIFYAGHGLRLARATAGGDTDRYYAFAPEDVAPDPRGYANVILASEIYALLRALEAGGATATVIADTCHSGGALRSIDDDVRERSLDVDPLPEAQWQQWLDLHPALRHVGAARGEALGPCGAYPGGDFVMLSGCLDCETSKEDTAVLLDTNGQEVRVPHGLLTLSLLHELEAVAPDRVRSLRWMDVYDGLRATVGLRAIALRRSPQTPSLEGRPEKTIFGGAWRPFEPGFTVRTTPDGLLRLDAGECHGLEAGAVIAIHPPDTSDLHDAREPGLRAVIESATPLTSRARLLDASAPVADRSRARLAKPAQTCRPVVVRVTHPESMSDAMRRSMQEIVAQSGTVTLIESDAAGAEAQVRPWRGDVPPLVWPAGASWRGARDGWVIVGGDRLVGPTAAASEVTPDDIVAYLPGAGAPLDEVAPERRDEALALALGRGLDGYARFLRARDRRANDDTLSGMLEVRLRTGSGAVPQRHTDIEAVCLAEPRYGVFEVGDPHWIWAEIRVVGRTSLRLQIGWLAFSDDGNVQPLWPAPGAELSLSRGEVVHVGFDREQALALSRRPDQTVSRWTLKALACTSVKDAPPIDFWSFGLPSVQDLFAEVLAAARGAGQRAAAGPARASTERPAWYAWDLKVAVKRGGS